MKHAERLVAFAVLLAALTAARPARAQDATAEALFEEGRRLLKQGKIAEACVKLDASEHLESSVGTLLNLADCREKNGELATAWATFVKAAAEARRSDHDDARTKEAARRARAIEARLSHLTISVPESNAIPGLTVERGGVAIDAALWNTEIPIDPGTYEITAEAPGNQPWSETLTLVEGQRASVNVPRFKSIDELHPPAPAPAPAPTPAPAPSHDLDLDAPPPPPAPPRPRAPTFSTARWVAVGGAGAGVVAIGGGVWSELVGLAWERRADGTCPKNACTSTRAISDNATARHYVAEADVLFVGGGALVVGGALLWFLDRPSAPSLEIAPLTPAGDVGLTLTGSF